MNIIIAGAGELGRVLAAVLCKAGHNITLLDAHGENFRSIADRYDILTLEGSCVNVRVLKDAGIAHTDALLAVSGDEASNILASRIASLFHVPKTVCRLYDSDSFSVADGITAESFGIWRTFSALDETAKKILDILPREDLLEQIRFANSDARMSVMRISRFSPLAGVQVKDIPCRDLLQKVRLAALVREKKFIALNGFTILRPGDRVYVSGRVEDVDNFLDWISQEQCRKRSVVIAGTGDAVLRLMGFMNAEYPSCHVSVIGDDQRKNTEFLQRVNFKNLSMYLGDITDPEVQKEAGVPRADLFISMGDDDENGILSCIIAKRLGTRKTVAVTHKPEYEPIVSALEQVDCGFNVTTAALNTVLRLLDEGIMHVDGELQQSDAHLMEFLVEPGSELADKALMESKLPQSAVLALVFRGREVIAPSGSTVLRAGDVVTAIVTPGSFRKLRNMFRR